MTKAPTLAGDEGGFALAAVIFVVALLGLLAITSLAMTGDDRGASIGVRQGTQAFYAAEAGANLVLADWDSLQYDTLMAAPGDSADLGWQTLSESGATYHAVVSRIDDGTVKTFDLVVEGRSPGGRGGRQTLAVQLSTFPLYPYGVLGRDDVSSGGTGDIIGNVGTNGDVDLTGGSLVIGDAAAGGTVNDPGNVTGTVTNGVVPISLPDVACPAGAYGPAPTGLGVNFNAGTGTIGLTGNDDKTFLTGTYYYHDISKDGSGELIVPTGNVVEIYIDGTLSFDGGGFNNPSGNSGNLRLYGCDNNTSNWLMNGDSDSWLSIYAPSVRLGLEGDGNRYGQFIAGEINHANAGNLSYDVNGAFRGGYAPVPGSWIQLYF